MSQSNQYIGVISKDEKGNHFLYTTTKREYITKQGDIAFYSPNPKTLHLKLVEALDENEIQEIDLCRARNVLTPRQINYINNRHSYINTYVAYHMYPDTSSIYTIIARTKNKVEYVYVSEKMIRTGLGMDKYLIRAVERVEHIFKKTALVHSTIQIHTKNTNIVMPWEHEPTLLRADALCRGEKIKYPLRKIIL